MSFSAPRGNDTVCVPLQHGQRTWTSTDGSIGSALCQTSKREPQCEQRCCSFLRGREALAVSVMDPLYMTTAGTGPADDQASPRPFMKSPCTPANRLKPSRIQPFTLARSESPA